MLSLHFLSPSSAHIVEHLAALIKAFVSAISALARPSRFLHNAHLYRALWLCIGLSFPTMVAAKQPSPPQPSSQLLVPSPQQIDQKADTITLKEALQQSQKANLHIARARALVQFAQAKERTQALQWLPTLDLRLDGYLRGGHTQGNFGDEKDLSSPLYQFSPIAQINYVLHPARLFLRQQAAAQRTFASRHHTTQVQDAILLATALAHQTLAQRQIQLAFLNQSIDTLHKVQQIAEARLRAGIGNQAEVLQIQSRLEQDTQSKISVLFSLRKKAAQFAILLGRSSQRLLLAKAQTLFSLSFPSTPTSPQQLIQTIQQQHPALETQRAQFKAFSYLQQSILLSPWIPSLQLQLTGGLFEAGLFQQKDTLPIGPQYAAFVSIKWSFSFVDLGRYDEFNAKQQLQQNKIDSLQLALETQSHLAFQRAQLATQRRQAAQRFVTTAEQALALTKARYKTGTGTLIDVLSTQRTLLYALMAWLEATTASNRAQFILRAMPGNLHPHSFAP